MNMNWWIQPLAVFRIRAVSAWHDTRGMVLPLTFFILVLLAGLVAALLSVGAMESQISANLLRTTQAFDLAEAGAERAMAAFVATPSLVGSATGPGALIDLPGSPFPALGSVGTYTVKYQPIGPSTVLVQSTGQSSIGSITQRVQVVITAPPASGSGSAPASASLPYAIVGDDTELSGSARINKDPTSLTGGSVYGLTKTSLTGTSWVDQTATSHTSTCTGCTDASHVGNVAGGGGNKPAQTLETKSPLDYKSQADFIMQDNSTILVQKDCPSPRCVPAVVAGQVVSQDTAPFKGWKMTASTPGDWHWSQTITPPNGTYYSTQELSIDKSVGSASTPWQATLLSGDATRTGELEINKVNGQQVYINAYLTVDGVPILAVAGAFVLGSDHDVTGALTGTIVATTKSRTSIANCSDGPPPCDNGHSFPSVQMGNHENLTGQLISDGQVLMSGNATITYKDNSGNPGWVGSSGGGGSSGAPQIISWTRVAQ